MKNILVILPLAMAIFSACQNDEQALENTVDGQDSAPRVVYEQTTGTLQHGDSIKDETVAPPDSLKQKVSPKAAVAGKHSSTKAATKSRKVTSEKATVLKDTAVMTAEEKRRARDLEEQLNDAVNNNPNPDNFNGVGEIADESNYAFTLVPMYAASDLAFYYVQFAVEAEKLSRGEIAKMINGDDTVYVVLHEGLFKYSLGRSKTENEALEKLRHFKKKYQLNDTEVLTYRSAW